MRVKQKQGSAPAFALSNPIAAKKVLIAAMQEAEEIVISAEED